MNLFEALKDKYNLVTVLGPTASGKTTLATRIASEFNTEIISADSRQVYRNMNIGTGKDIEEYTIDDRIIPYHLIDIAEAGEKYNVFQYQQDFFSVFNDILRKIKIPIMCGGTGLYIDAIINNYNLTKVPENESQRKVLEQKNMNELENILISLKKTHNVSDFDSKKRIIRAIEIEKYLKKHPEEKTDFPKIKSLNFGIKFDRQKQRERITERLKERLNNGMIDEVQHLLDVGVSPDTLIYYGLEYKFVTTYLLNEISYNQMVEKLNIAIHQFSKRQMTWFRRMEKRNEKIWWINGDIAIDKKIDRVKEVIFDYNIKKMSKE
ncbi:MAG: tRNA (adenosine(37)-N6)-dimethylallyltransferase MiaA [Bacteroidota bacterium]|nr:tRNA (adenosine(37)-N6)-dimethylallyltransferase MiaA [Bacteroidota bacterium]